VGCTFLDADDTAKPVVMGSYGIGVGRLLACVAEEHHDEQGLTWPVTVAPFDVYVVALRGGEDGAAQLASELAEQGLDVLLDDRDERPGVKFNDADLIGVPIRMTVSARTVADGQAELKLRRDAQPSRVPLQTAAGAAGEECAALNAGLRPDQ
jgi:prolyl-tRNA synthetase